MNCKIISVESRKGGVGKTTAALNLATLLLGKGYRVLLLDVDITGTSISGSYQSSYWKNALHPVTMNGVQVNLLEIFHNYIASGSEPPTFTITSSRNSLRIVNDKVNVLSSEIYGQDAALICDPRILFDELHSFWLIDLLKTLCASFVKTAKSEKTVILLDNSPGYVGLGRAIHEWLTDIGPQDAKFLTVSSLDIQDLNSCLNAIRAIDKILAHKIMGARHYFELQKKDSNHLIHSLPEPANRFFLKLIASGSEADEFAYFRRESLVNPTLPNYQSLIINKAPTEIKAGNLYYDLYVSLAQNRSNMETLTLFSGQRLDSNSRNVVFFDNHLHFQFIEPFIKKSEGNKSTEIIRLRNKFTSIKRLINRHKSKISVNEDTILNTINTYERNFYQLLICLRKAGYGIITQLIETRWRPEQPLNESEQAFNIFCNSSPSVKRNNKTSEATTNRIVNDHTIKRKIRNLLNNISNLAINSPQATSFQKEYDQITQTLCYFLAKKYLADESLSKQNDSLFASLIILIMILRNYRITNLYSFFGGRLTQHFLAIETVSPSDFAKYEQFIRNREYRHIPHLKEIQSLLKNPELLSPLYNIFCHAQARLLDMHDDFEVLISVLRQISIEKLEDSSLLPNISNILDKAIIQKSIPYSVANNIFNREKKDTEYLKTFRRVLMENIINKWEM